MLRRLATVFYALVARLFYPRCAWLVEWNPLAIRGYVLFQRILNINGARSVPWPVHFTSRVTGRVVAGRMSSPGFMPGGYFNGANGIEVGDDVWIGPGVTVISANHDRSDMTRHVIAPPVRIGDRVWIGANAVILPGVRIGEAAVVGAGAVVTKDVPAGAVGGGNPARMLRQQEEAHGA
jgi:acetyltransferase-like isoleucine patch superfamily enzyme